MFKVAILGCENSHADNFLKVIAEQYSDKVQVLGVFSEYEGAAEKLQEQFGVPVMESADALVGQLDGVIITARHGGKHYPYAKPYLNDGVPLFIDKPITVSEAEAREFAGILREKNIPASGGSTLKHAPYLAELKEAIAAGEKGRILGGYFRAPVNLENEYGDFFFYSQHLVQMVCEVFGYYPKAVRTCRTGKQITCIFRYEDFDVTGLYVDGSYVYYASVHFQKGAEGQVFKLGTNASADEFRDFYELLEGKPQCQSYEDLFQPVFIMNALHRSLESGAEEPVGRL